ncbi:hypothetical protein [Tunturiibacter lichenicola]|uniref:hypothetical protein n=1 Tax=Tunturiibacter lichenicola TaxID=2051959 RepID=UPI003D9B73FE
MREKRGSTTKMGLRGAGFSDGPSVDGYYGHPKVSVKRQNRTCVRLKKYFTNLSHFSAPKNPPQNHHVHHAIHHRLTSKTPRFASVFFQKPLQKPHSTTPEKNPATKSTATRFVGV